MVLNLRPLHNLYQTISPASLLEEDLPLIAISQLERKGKQPSGEIHWVLGLGTKAEEEIWWETRLNAEEIEDLAKQLKGTAITRDMMVEGIRSNWNEGRLDVKGFKGPSAKERGKIELVIYLMKEIPLSITLSPVEKSPLSLLSIMAHIIPPYISSSSSQTALQTLRPQLAASNQERDKLQSEATLLREEVKELRKRMKEGEGERRNGKRARTEESSQSQTGGSSQNQSGRGASASVSPQKKGRPGIDYKAVMKPGTKGYAGSSNRVGRNLDDEWEEPDSDWDEAWGRTTIYEPGWTPLEWGTDLKQNITLEVWNDQEIVYNIQKKILRFLNDFRENLLKYPQVAPDIYMRDFPSFERLRWLGHHSIRGLTVTRADSWMRKMTLKDYTKWQQTFTMEVRSARYNSGDLNNLFDECIESLRTVKDSNVFTTWFNAINEDIKLHWFFCVRHGRLPEVIGALKACREMLEKAKEVVDTILRLCLPSASELMVLCGLVDGGTEQHSNHRFAPRKRQRDEVPDGPQYHQSRPRPSFPYPRRDFDDSTVLQNGNSDHLTGQLAIHQCSNLEQHPHSQYVAETNRYSSSSAISRNVEPSDGLDELVKQILKLYASSFDIPGWMKAEKRLRILVNAARHAPRTQAIQIVREYLETLIRGGVLQLPVAESLPDSLLALGRINATTKAIQYNFS